MDYQKEHSINKELDNVHIRMKRRYAEYERAEADIEKAKKMETYLRKFKEIGKNKNKNNPAYQDNLEAQAWQQIAQEVGNSLKITNSRGTYSLFGNVHSQYIGQQADWGADDVFEAEFVKLLEIVGEKASNKKVDINTGVSLMGKSTANIDKSGLEAFYNLPKEFTEDFYSELDKKGKEIVKNKSIPSKLIQAPTFKSGKIDATGFNREWVIESDIKPEWLDFIQTFSGATFTLKNYNSNSKTEVIHLGSSNLYKAMYGTLNEELNYPPDESAHIYYHTVMSYSERKEEDVGSHITHMRFAYELAGGGLYDNQHNKLSAADFFIYNDPVSSNIWVRSTKEMIANVMSYLGKLPGDPLTSNIVILKQAFQ